MQLKKRALNFITFCNTNDFPPELLTFNEFKQGKDQVPLYYNKTPEVYTDN